MVRAITAETNSKLCSFIHSFTAFGQYLVGAEIPEKYLDQQGGIPEKLKVAVGEPPDRRRLLILMTAIKRPRIKESAIETADSWIVIFRPETSHSKYCPDVMIAQSN